MLSSWGPANHPLWPAVLPEEPAQEALPQEGSTTSEFLSKDVSASEILKLQIKDWILFPILIVEVPPLGGINLETLFLHGFAQQAAASALVVRAACVVSIRTLGHLVVAARHLHFFTCLQIV